MNLAQRVVLVVALAALLRLAGIYIITKGFSGPGGGWFGYAPGTHAIISADDGRLGPAAEWFVWLTLLALWTTASLWLLGLGQESPPGDDG